MAAGYRTPLEEDASGGLRGPGDVGLAAGTITARGPVDPGGSGPDAGTVQGTPGRNPARSGPGLPGRRPVIEGGRAI